MQIKEKLKNNSLQFALKEIVGHVKGHELWLGILLPSLFINLLALVFPILMLTYYDRIIPNKALDTLFILAILVVVAVVVETILKCLRLVINHKASARFEHLCGMRVFSSVFYSRSQKAHQMSPAAMLERMSALFSVKDFYGGQALSLLIDLPFVLLYLLLIGYIGGILVFIPLLSLVFFFIGAERIGAGLRVLLNRRKQFDDRRYSFVLEMLKGIKLVKTLTVEPFVQRRHERLQSNAGDVDYDISELSQHAMVVSSTLQQLSVITMVSLGAVKIIEGSLTVGALAACTLLANRSQAPLASAMMFWKRIQTIIVTHQRVESVCENVSDSFIEESKRHYNLNGNIELKNIDFHFLKDTPLFSNLSLKIEEKSTIAIVGEGSSGRSSLMKLIMGVHRHQQGDILFDGTSIDELNVVSLRKNIAYIPQKSSLFNGTIMENLTLFDTKYITRALNFVHAMGLDKKIHALPDGYETVVGDAVVDSLDTGTKQQILTIQTLIHYPEIVIFDEANANVDMETDKSLIGLLNKLKSKVTLILISHRPSLIALAEKKYKLEDGKLELIKENQRGK